MELHLRMSSSPLDAKISREPILNQDFAKRRTIAAACYRKKWSLICFLCFHRPFKATVMLNNWNKVEKVRVGGSSIGLEYFITCTVCTTYHIIITITLHNMTANYGLLSTRHTISDMTVFLSWTIISFGNIFKKYDIFKSYYLWHMRVFLSWTIIFFGKIFKQ